MQGCEPLPRDAVWCWGGHSTAGAGSRVLVPCASPPSFPLQWVKLQAVMNGPREAMVAAGHG